MSEGAGGGDDEGGAGRVGRGQAGDGARADVEVGGGGAHVERAVEQGFGGGFEECFEVVRGGDGRVGGGGGAGGREP